MSERRRGWIPNGWRITEMLSDGSRQIVAVAKVLMQLQADKRFTPAMKPPVRNRIVKGWVRALSRAKAWEQS